MFLCLFPSPSVCSISFFYLYISVSLFLFLFLSLDSISLSLLPLSPSLTNSHPLSQIPVPFSWVLWLTPALVAEGRWGWGGGREDQPPSCTLLWPHHLLSSAQSDRGEHRTEDGLVKGHAYSVTGTHKVSIFHGWAGRGCPGANPH